MLGHHPRHARRHSERPPFARILCAVDGGAAADAAIEQAIAVAGDDAHVVFAGEHAAQAVDRARAAGVDARAQRFGSPRLVDALLSAAAQHDLVVAGAHPHSRATGIVLGETATILAHRSRIPVLIARERPLASGVVVATRALPGDRPAVTAATHIAARLGAELTILHVPERHDDARRAELAAELANARALLGRAIDRVDMQGPVARTIVDVAHGDGAGLVVVGSDSKHGLPALRSVSERVSHLAPCSVLVMREG